MFHLDQDGSLNSSTVFNFETNASSFSIRVQAKDEYNATTEGNFTIILQDVYEDTDGDGFRDSLEASLGSDLNDKTSTPLQQGLVAWYPFDGNASDMSGNGNDGTVNGATLGTNRHGQAGKAYQTNGNGFISVSDSPILDIDGQKSLTVSAWFKSSGNHRQFILQKKNINTIGTYRPGYFIDLNNQVVPILWSLIVHLKKVRQLRMLICQTENGIMSWRFWTVQTSKQDSTLMGLL